MNTRNGKNSEPDRVARLWNKVVDNRQRYIDSVKGERVFVKPSIPMGGVLSIKILGSRPIEKSDKTREKYGPFVNAGD